MKVMLALVFLFASVVDGIMDISKINKIKKQAQEAYLQKDYAAAATQYKKLVDDFKVEDDNVWINLANSYYGIRDTVNASLTYQKAASASNKSIRSQALSQLGVIAHSKNDINRSMSLFKEALKTDPSNEVARYNYELVKKSIENQKEQEEGEDEKDGEEDKIKPSDFAKKLKEQADNLVLNRKYSEAFDLMINGLKKDQTVSFYKDFIGRLNDIVEIQK